MGLWRLSILLLLLHTILITTALWKTLIAFLIGSWFLLYVRPVFYLGYILSIISFLFCETLIAFITIWDLGRLCLPIITTLFLDKSSFRICIYSISIMIIRLKTRAPTWFHQYNAILQLNYPYYNSFSF